MSRSFKVQQNADGVPFFQPHRSSPFVVGKDEEGSHVVPSVGRNITENSVRVDEYKQAKADAEREGQSEPDGYSVAEPSQDVVATLTQDQPGDWNIEDFLVGGLPPGADTEAIKLALRRHVALAVDDGVAPDERDEEGNLLDTFRGDELSELPTMRPDELKEALKRKGIEYEGDDVRDMKEKLTSAILMDVDATQEKYLSGKYAKSDEADGGAADFEALHTMMDETAAIGIRTNGEEDWNGNGAKDGKHTLVGGQLFGDSNEPLLLGEADSADLLLAASDGAFSDINGKEQVLDIYFDEMFDRAAKGDATTAPYGITPADLVGKPIAPEQKNSDQ